MLTVTKIALALFLARVVLFLQGLWSRLTVYYTISPHHRYTIPSSVPLPERACLKELLTNNFSSVHIICLHRTLLRYPIGAVYN
jgi:hypothetical protein